MTRFQGGTAYHRPGKALQVSLRGSHYEMGVQYGVLLRDEIRGVVEVLDGLFGYLAEENAIWKPFLGLYFDSRSERILKQVPQRFVEEMRGVAYGSGVDFNLIRRINTLYDVSRLSACTSILCRGNNGGIIHARTQDVGWGIDWPETVLVKFQPAGFHAFVSVSWPGFLGTQTWLTGNALWAVNRYLYPDYRRDVEDVYVQDNGGNRGRTAILDRALQADSYGIDDIIAIMRSSVGPEGKDYLEDYYLRGVCNQNTLQMAVFDP